MFVCRSRCKRPPASSHPPYIPHGNPRTKLAGAGNSRNPWCPADKPEVAVWSDKKKPLCRNFRLGRQRTSLPSCEHPARASGTALGRFRDWPYTCTRCAPAASRPWGTRRSAVASTGGVSRSVAAARSLHRPGRKPPTSVQERGPRGLPLIRPGRRGRTWSCTGSSASRSASKSWSSKCWAKCS